MTFQVRLRGVAVRETMIQSAINASPAAFEDFYEFKNCKMSLPKVRLDQSCLVYRMENFRTFTEQQAIIIRDKKPATYFLNGQENESIQQVQHDILVKLARKGHADSVTPVFDVLKSERQREAVLITHRGVVVNGNRRLAAMRELLAEDSSANADFAHVDCLVLPADATPADIVGIEAGLQGKRETKLDYDWIGDSQLIQKLIDLGSTQKQVAELLHRDVAEIRRSIQAFDEATIYLRDWVGAAGDYARVTDEAEQFFKDLPNQLQGKDQSLIEASRVLAWNLFDNRAQLGDRLYAFNVVIGKSASDALERLSSELGIPLTGSASEDDDGGFSIDVDAGQTSPNYEPVIAAFRDTGRKREAIERLVEVAQSIVEEGRARKAGGAALKAVITANSRLQEVDIGRADPATHAAIRRQLEQITKRAAELTALLARSGEGDASGAAAPPA